MADRYALVRAGRVENIVEWDGGSGWAPPAGLDPVRLDMRRIDHRLAAADDSYDGEGFTKPVRQPRAIERFGEVGIVEFTDALLTSMVQEGVIPTAAQALGIAQRMRNKLTR